MHDEAYINQLILQMETLGYFRFASDNDLEELKEDLWFGFKIKAFNPTLDEELMSAGKEKRYFMLDHLSVMDRDFVPFFLEEIEPVLNLLNFDIDELEIPKSRNYKEKICNIIDAVNRIIVSDPATSEQFYLINKDDELGCYLLTPALQMIFETHIEDPDDRPLSTEDWQELHY